MRRYRVVLCALACFLASTPLTFADSAESDEPLVDLAPTATLILRDAKAGVLKQASSPAPGQLDLDGFVFTGFDGPQTLAFQRTWLLGQKDPASSQPYEQVATVLRAMGLDDQAREILVIKNEEQGKKAQGPGGSFGTGFLGPFIGYGYHPWCAFYLVPLLHLNVSDHWMPNPNRRNGSVT
jgi:hypothetical protein